MAAFGLHSFQDSALDLVAFDEERALGGSDRRSTQILGIAFFIGVVTQLDWGWV
jgi:hypothetical protein